MAAPTRPINLASAGVPIVPAHRVPKSSRRSTRPRRYRRARENKDDVSLPLGIVPWPIPEQRRRHDRPPSAAIVMLQPPLQLLHEFQRLVDALGRVLAADRGR